MFKFLNVFATCIHPFTRSFIQQILIEHLPLNKDIDVWSTYHLWPSNPKGIYGLTSNSILSTLETMLKFYLDSSGTVFHK